MMLNKVISCKQWQNKPKFNLYWVLCSLFTSWYWLVPFITAMMIKQNHNIFRVIIAIRNHIELTISYIYPANLRWKKNLMSVCYSNRHLFFSDFKRFKTDLSKTKSTWSFFMVNLNETGWTHASKKAIRRETRHRKLDLPQCTVVKVAK